MKYKATQGTCFMVGLLNIEPRETVSLFLAKLTFFQNTGQEGLPQDYGSPTPTKAFFWQRSVSNTRAAQNYLCACISFK